MKPHRLLALATFILAGLGGLAALPAARAAGAAVPPPGTPTSTAAPLAVSNGWVRWLPNGLPEAGYLTLTNRGDQPLDLVSASSPDFGSVMLHQSISNGSTQRMVMVDKLTIPAHGTVAIAPGGYHLMLMAATHPIAPGATVQIILKFSNGATLAAALPVRPPTAQ